MSEEIKLDLSQVSFNNLIDDKAPAPVLEQEVPSAASVPEEAENSLPEAEISEESGEEQPAEVSEPEKTPSDAPTNDDSEVDEPAEEPSQD